ncbi:winged helix-turn-helix domain-containing protein [Streptomyces sp. MC1]|uniref:winged helix-turn-helix domain-containing protein n=1 Tax=Streptomyces sp. MC1 TaxID=295105 RepID=UPI0035A8AEB0
MATLIGRKLHVSYSVSGATRLMHRFGFSPQVLVRRVAERDEQADTEWNEATWNEVIEPGRPAAAASFRGRGRLHPPATRRTHLGPARYDSAGDVEGATLGRPVRGRADRHAARLAYSAVPPSAHPPPGMGTRRSTGGRCSMGERDFIALIDGTHQLVKAPIRWTVPPPEGRGPWCPRPNRPSEQTGPG